jgi:hypothetical protein
MPSGNSSFEEQSKILQESKEHGEKNYRKI